MANAPKNAPVNGYLSVWPPPHVCSSQLRISQDSKVICEMLDLHGVSSVNKVKRISKFLGIVKREKDAVYEKFITMLGKSASETVSAKIQQSMLKLQYTDTLTLAAKAKELRDKSFDMKRFRLSASLDVY